VRRRICVVGAALSAVPLAFGVSLATAATSKPKIKPTKVTCTTNIGVMIASGDTGVVPPAQQGTEYGQATCGKLLGSGVQVDRFTVPDSGDIVATFKLFFPTGTVHGTYDLTPQEGTFTGTNFTEVDSIGTLMVLGGSGTFKGVKGTGTMTCKTLDGIHTSCSEHLKLKLTPLV
jgi:hypothetical protein